MNSWILRSFFAALLVAPAIRAADITVSAAISMKDALTDAGKSFDKSTGNHVSFNFLASGPLMKQIEEGAPVDVFISAAHEQMDELEKRNLIDPPTRQDVADGELVVIVPIKTTIDRPTSVEDLANPRFQRIAIGEPATVPAGLYAKQSLTSLKLFDRLHDRLKTAANVRQVLEYVERGEVDAGFVYRTDAIRAGDQVSIAVTVSASDHEPIVYPGAVIARSAHAAEAKSFLRYLESPVGRATLKHFGFLEPATGYDAGKSMSDLWAAPWETLALSLRIATTATLLTALVAIPTAWFLARQKFPGKTVIETVLAVPLVLPPTVVGYLMIYLLGIQSPIGAWLDHYSIRLLFSEWGAVLAAAVVSFPLLLLPARAAFASVEHELEDIAHLMGAGPVRIFWHVSLPIARRGIAGGLLLAFARALGEFGATVMVFGITHKTLPILIWYENESSDLRAAAPAVCLLLAISLGVIAILNLTGLGQREK